ncbi:hypothetical protein D3C76_1297790 [compost metagenome]
MVEQHLADVPVDAEVRPGGTGYLAQVVTGPLAHAQPGEHGARLVVTERHPTTRREQVGALIASSQLNGPVPLQQSAYLVGQG